MEDLETDAPESRHECPPAAHGRADVPPERPPPCPPDPESLAAPSPAARLQSQISSGDRIDFLFLSASEKFVELPMQPGPDLFLIQAMEEVGGGRNESYRLSVVEEALLKQPLMGRSSSLSNTPHASEESSVDEEQPKVKTPLYGSVPTLFSVKTNIWDSALFTLFLILIKTEEGLYRGDRLAGTCWEN